MKICRKCGETKARSEFHKNKFVKDGLSERCKSCRKKDGHQYYIKSKDKKIEHNHAYLKRNKEFVKRYKKTRKCEECGESRWYVLDFHHIRDKDIDISLMVLHKSSIKRIKNEIRKCIVLCSNCHRALHFLEKNVP